MIANAIVGAFFAGSYVADITGGITAISDLKLSLTVGHAAAAHSTEVVTDLRHTRRRDVVW